MKDKTGQTVDVVKEWHRTKQFRIRITINKGKADERDILLDTEQAKELTADIVDAL